MDGAFMRSGVSSGRWCYEEIQRASHWVPLDATGRINELRLQWLNSKARHGPGKRVHAGLCHTGLALPG
jgi:hypothetical protein